MPRHLAPLRVLGGTLAVVMTSTGCVTDAVTGKQQLSVVDWTAEEELAMGRDSAPNIESQFDAIYPDAGVNEQLGAIVRRMVEFSPRREDFDFHFKVLNSSVPNAFALPGGYVYITRGLLQSLETEGQFISVLGHELGHVEHRHSMLNASRDVVLMGPVRPWLKLGEIMPIGGGLVTTTTVLVAAPSILLGLKFDRDQELQADGRGVYFATSMGYDPRDAIKTFELFEQMERESGDETAKYAIFRTHPLNKDRIDYIQEAVATDYPAVTGKAPSDFRAEDPGFAAILRGFHDRAAAYEAYDEARQRLENPYLNAKELPEIAALTRRARTSLPDEPLFAILAGELALKQQQKQPARQAFQTAEDLYERLVPGDGHWKPYLYLGMLDLEDGNARRAVERLRRSTELYPLNGVAYVPLGRAYEKSGDRARAIEAYEEAVNLTPPGSEASQAALDRLRVLRAKR